MLSRIFAEQMARKAVRAVGDHVRDAVEGSLGLSGERMSKVDTAWLRMDTESNLMFAWRQLVGQGNPRPGAGQSATE